MENFTGKYQRERSSPIETLNFPSYRTLNALLNAKITNIGELLDIYHQEEGRQLKDIKGFGRKAYEEVSEAIDRLEIIPEPISSEFFIIFLENNSLDNALILQKKLQEGFEIISVVGLQDTAIYILKK